MNGAVMVALGCLPLAFGLALITNYRDAPRRFWAISDFWGQVGRLFGREPSATRERSDVQFMRWFGGSVCLLIAIAWIGFGISDLAH
jgi:hypothetical protein